MSVAAWAASIRGLESPPSSAPGDWNRPAIDVRHTVWDMKQASPSVVSFLVLLLLPPSGSSALSPNSSFLIDGTVDLDNRFFIGPNGYFYVRLLIFIQNFDWLTVFWPWTGFFVNSRPRKS